MGYMEVANADVHAQIYNKIVIHWYDIRVPDVYIDFVNVACLAYANSMDYSHWDAERLASKPAEDAMVSKWGEVGAMFFLRLLGLTCSPVDTSPDFEIYPVHRKTWKADLDLGGHPVHVKTFTGKSREYLESVYEKKDFYSRTFQNCNNSGSRGRDAIFDKPDCKDLVVMMYIDDIEKPSEQSVVATAPFYKISHLLNDPLVSKYKTVKKCIDLDNLIFARDCIQ